MNWPISDLWESQDQCLGGSGVWNESAIRLATAHIARSVVGLSPISKAYHELCYPYDSPWRARAMAVSQSACALVCGGILRLLGLDHERLNGPYWGRSDAVSRLETIAVDQGAFDRRPILPLVGDMCIIGEGIGTHALTVIGYDNVGNELISVDGGRRSIRIARRRVVRNGTVYGLLDGMGRRYIYGVIKTSKLDLTKNWATRAGYFAELDGRGK